MIRGFTVKALITPNVLGSKHLGWFCKIRPVEQIEGIPPEDQVHTLRERSGLNYRDVSRCRNPLDRALSGYYVRGCQKRSLRLLTRDICHVVDTPPGGLRARDKRRGNKSVRVEEFVA